MLGADHATWTPCQLVRTPQPSVRTEIGSASNFDSDNLPDERLMKKNTPLPRPMSLKTTTMRSATTRPISSRSSLSSKRSTPSPSWIQRPAMENALALREGLEKTVRRLDPRDLDAATKRIVVLGHSMGGVISHTLVSSSGDRVWMSVFRVPPDQLKGDPQAIRQLERVLHFRRNSRVARVIFMATPHRGSPMSDSVIGRLGNALSRLAPMEERGFSALITANPEAMMPGAAQFYAGGRFSAVRTLSPKATAVIALSELPIEVPFHSIIGQKHPGRKENGSDGVVPYWSSHLEGAASERIVRGGHQVIGNPQAIDEVVQILQKSAR